MEVALRVSMEISIDSFHELDTHLEQKIMNNN